MRARMEPMHARFVPVLLGVLAAASIAATDAAPAATDRAARTRAELEALRERIESVRESLAAERRRRDRASDALAGIEQRIGRLAGRIEALDDDIAGARARLERLRQRRADVLEELGAHRGTLADQLRAAYRLGRQPALRLLLRQDDPAALARALGYYRYFNRARVAAIERAHALVTELEDVSARTRDAEARLEADRAELDRRRAALEDARAERRRLLARLQRSIEDKGQRLEALEADRERLRGLLRDLAPVLDDIPAAPLEARPFPTRQGELAWPVRGGLRARFGAARASGRTTWQGIVIAADAGTRVRAVYHGRVVFADWLSGFGQLIIVDHLDGYYSLYGYNERLLRGTGDWVAPGDAIATVGESGGRGEPGLYFEIRRQGQPVDPLPWLAAR